MDKFKKLSEAMRFGATLSEQSFNILYCKDNEEKITHTCAIGAVYHAISLETLFHADFILACQRFEALREKINSCPIIFCKFGESDLAHYIVHLNNTHKWSRERIAGWLENIGC